MITYKKPHKSGCPVHLDTSYEGVLLTQTKVKKNDTVPIAYTTGRVTDRCTVPSGNTI